MEEKGGKAEKKGRRNERFEGRKMGGWVKGKKREGERKERATLTLHTLTNCLSFPAATTMCPSLVLKP